MASGWKNLYEDVPVVFRRGVEEELAPAGGVEISREPSPLGWVGLLSLWGWGG